jgi:hypothetical protein
MHIASLYKELLACRLLLQYWHYQNNGIVEPVMNSNQETNIHRGYGEHYDELMA